MAVITVLRALSVAVCCSTLQCVTNGSDYCKGPFWVCMRLFCLRVLLSVFRALLGVCRALLSVCRALLGVHETLLSGSFECTYVYMYVCECVGCGTRMHMRYNCPCIDVAVCCNVLQCVAVRCSTRNKDLHAL